MILYIIMLQYDCSHYQYRKICSTFMHYESYNQCIIIYDTLTAAKFWIFFWKIKFWQKNIFALSLCWACPFTS